MPLADEKRPQPEILSAPIIGFLNLRGESAAAALEADRAVLAPLFRGAVTSTGDKLWCHVLFLYCTLDADGRVIGPKGNTPLRELAKESNARLVILASD